MRTEYVNSENSIFEKLCTTEKSQALIIVGWLGAPEDLLSVLKKLRQHIEVVDLSRKVINFLSQIRRSSLHITEQEQDLTLVKPAKSFTSLQQAYLLSPF
jgi:hypothetical protein